MWACQHNWAKPVGNFNAITTTHITHSSQSRRFSKRNTLMSGLRGRCETWPMSLKFPFKTQWLLFYTIRLLIRLGFAPTNVSNQHFKCLYGKCLKKEEVEELWELIRAIHLVTFIQFVRLHQGLLENRTRLLKQDLTNADRNMWKQGLFKTQWSNKTQQLLDVGAWGG